MSAPSSLLSQRDRRLDEFVVALAARADDRAIIQTVETWAIAGSPTRRARLHEARAFFNLKLMDRAMARAREVVELNPDDHDAQRLLAEIYLERGWPSHARKLIAQLQASSHDSGLEVLAARAHAEPSRLASHAREIEAGGDSVQMLSLAEHFLTTGSFFRARSILERLRRANPDSRRIQELLWGLDGVFTSKEISLDVLLEHFEKHLSNTVVEQPIPLVDPVAEPVQESGVRVLAGPENLSVRILTGDIPDEAEHTESARMFDSRVQEAFSGEFVPEESISFPSLFKSEPRKPTQPDSGAERTSVSKIARRQADDFNEHTDPGGAPVPMLAGDAPGRNEDTQIMLVLRPGEKASSKAMHKPAAPGSGEAPRETLNLREWQQSMGMTPPPDISPSAPLSKDPARASAKDIPGDIPGDFTADFSEDSSAEDENIVLVKRQEPQNLEPEPSEVRNRPIEVIERVPTPISGSLFTEPPSLEESASPREDQGDTADNGEEVEEEESSENRSNILIRLLAVVVVLMLFVLAVVVVALVYFQT